MMCLVKADLTRIFRKISIWTLFLFLIAADAALVVATLRMQFDSTYNFTTINGGFMSVFSLCYSYWLVQSIYAEDFRSMTVASVVGEGYRRRDVVLAKCIVTIASVTALFALAAAFVFGFTCVMGKTLSPTELQYIYYSAFYLIFETAGFVLIGSAVVYVSGNGALAILALVIISFGEDQLSHFLATFPGLAGLHLQRVLILSNVCSDAFSDMMIDQVPRGIAKLFLALAAFGGLSVAVSNLIFGRKELDL